MKIEKKIPTLQSSNQESRSVHEITFETFYSRNCWCKERQTKEYWKSFKIKSRTLEAFSKNGILLLSQWNWKTTGSIWSSSSKSFPCLLSIFIESNLKASCLTKRYSENNSRKSWCSHHQLSKLISASISWEMFWAVKSYIEDSLYWISPHRFDKIFNGILETLNFMTFKHLPRICISSRLSNYDATKERNEKTWTLFAEVFPAWTRCQNTRTKQSRFALCISRNSKRLFLFSIYPSNMNSQPNRHQT